MKQKQKKQSATLEDQKKIVKRKQEDIELMQNLLAPGLFTQLGSDEHLDHMLFKEKLMGEKELGEEDYTTQITQEYHRHFIKAFYYGIAKMYGIDKSKMDDYVKPFCAKFFTLQFIYARFPRKVLNALFRHKKSKGLSGIGNKLHQYLSDNAIQMLDLYIDQAIKVMDRCSDITEFKSEYSALYKIHFQIDLFSDKLTF